MIENLSRPVTGKDVESIIENLPTNKISGPDSSDGKESACSAGDPGSIPGSERSSGEGNANPLHYSYLENRMDGGAWQDTVHGVA